MKKLFLCVCLLLAGCAGFEYDRTVFSITDDVRLTQISDSSIVRETDGQITVQVRGFSPKRQFVYYKAEWFDGHGIKINTSLTQWKRVQLPEEMDFTWTLAAPTPKAVAYRIYITKNIGKGMIE